MVKVVLSQQVVSKEITVQVMVVKLQMALPYKVETRLICQVQVVVATTVVGVAHTLGDMVALVLGVVQVILDTLQYQMVSRLALRIRI